MCIRDSAWKYIKTEIKDFIQNAHVKAFQKLIGIFEEIWDLLGLPDLPFGQLMDILSLDIGAIIKAKIDGLRQAFEESKLGKLKKMNQIKKEIEELEEKIADTSISAEERTKLLEELEKKHQERKELKDDLLKEVREFHEGVLLSLIHISEPTRP